ncbi:MAG: 2-oxoglutarate dehydrogenase E1 component [Thermodesulfobacteriota bacterium]
MSFIDEFHGPNSGYILELYERYLNDPSSVDIKTKKIFDNWKPELNGTDKNLKSAYYSTNGNVAHADINIKKAVSVSNLARSIRGHGHMQSKIDPLGSNPPGDPTLNPEMHELSEDDLKMLPADLVGWPIAERASNAYEGIKKLREVYSSTIGYNYDHIYNSDERRWLREVIERGTFRAPINPIDPIQMLKSLTQVEVFETFLHRIFPGKFRFSIEGVDTLVPMLNELVGLAAKADIYHIILGMAHRGRLNVMHHVLNKTYKHTLIKFKDPILERDFRDDMGWTGDVKYHESASRSVNNGKPIDMLISLAPNPSHLESVNPVIQGMARAAGTKSDESGNTVFDSTVSIPVQIHGDAAFPGQGINAETLNLSRLPGYYTGGTIHIITNNQLGYTTLPSDGRSTLYSSDLAKGYEIPIVHVNADDPDACIETMRLAFAYLKNFNKDFLIDLVGYRRHGHNEADEPSFTQPTMYEKINTHPTVREVWANKLIKEKIISEDQANKFLEDQNEILHKEYESMTADDIPEESQSTPPPPGAAKNAKTSLPADELRELNNSLLEVPENFTVNSKIKKTRNKRNDILEDSNSKTIDWATAEELAYASILADGTPIRITGQDCERGTFSHRHAVLYDAKNGKPYIPLQSIPQAKASFDIHNSPLSENACIGFEYGYDVQKSDSLVIWEAQYGDFINGAQTIIDEYLVSARAKWGQTPSLVLLLPHAYEGQGPDHSSCRLERFLMSAAEYNIRIANCTSSAQFFHLLRRQAAVIEIDPLPLIVLTPKSLLRNPKIASSLNDLSQGKWMPVIDDSMDDRQANKVKRLILCSGKIYIDLISSEIRERHPEIAIVRVEQLYPRPKEEIRNVVARYPKINELVWVQEEPQNMGAWKYMLPFLRRKITNYQNQIHYIGRKRNSSPSEGSSSMHKLNQKLIIEQAFSIKKVVDRIEESGMAWNIY